MRRAGEVRGIAQSVAVVQCPDETHPDIGTSVIDDSLATVGRVVDVFGPVERPYLAVSPVDSVHPPALVGQPLYYR
ncbi:H/ACA RNA-protein complex component Gar1 [Halorhabdus utahensis DSM 12940]|uniref:H/ACA RNA-protein complex component Gar1 n=1 Tax=Halorhabdus utahensis (strain DSM 12940 / JCM 11049 / AX-2) TaxID=519442 RepID=C7NMX2_HALUD|nr:MULTISPECIES: Gar1/Naf1 family protein [Halorhabdus]ACV12670.1 H/ACA RNA-protein complex component Gar1 [Halorhabdus utahensis DSM 12940]